MAIETVHVFTVSEVMVATDSDEASVVALLDSNCMEPLLFGLVIAITLKSLAGQIIATLHSSAFSKYCSYVEQLAFAM